MDSNLVKATLSLRRDQVARLDRLAIDIRVNTGAVITRGELIRAFVDGIFELEPDLSTALNESEILARLRIRPVAERL